MEANVEPVSEPIAQADTSPSTDVQVSEPEAPSEAQAEAQAAEPEPFNWDEWDPEDIESLREEWREPVSKAVGRHKSKVSSELERYSSLLQMYQESAVTMPEHLDIKTKYEALLPELETYKGKLAALEAAQEEDIARSVSQQLDSFHNRYGDELKERWTEYSTVMDFIVDNDCGDSIPDEVIMDLVRAEDEDRSLFLQVLKGAGHEAVSKLMARNRPAIKAPAAPVLAVTKPKVVAPPAPPPKESNEQRLQSRLRQFVSQFS